MVNLVVKMVRMVSLVVRMVKFSKSGCEDEVY